MGKKLIIPLSFIVLIMNAVPVYAHCPLCTGAIGMAAVSMKYYGVDTSIIGIFIGAFAISTGLWIGRKIKRQYIRFQLPIIVLASFLLTVLPLSSIDGGNVFFPVLLFGEPGSVFNKIYWVNKIIFASIIGSMTTLAAFWIHNKVKKVNGGVLFPYQGLVFTLVLLGITGAAMYLMGV